MIHPVPYIDSEYDLVLMGNPITYRAMTFLYGGEFLKIVNIFKILAVYSDFSGEIGRAHV